MKLTPSVRTTVKSTYNTRDLRSLNPTPAGLSYAKRFDPRTAANREVARTRTAIRNTAARRG